TLALRTLVRPEIRPCRHMECKIPRRSHRHGTTERRFTMRGFKATAATAVAFFAIASCSLAQSSGDARPAPDRLKMSISSSLFQGMPEALVIALMKPFE